MGAGESSEMVPDDQQRACLLPHKGQAPCPHSGVLFHSSLSSLFLLPCCRSMKFILCQRWGLLWEELCQGK